MSYCGKCGRPDIVGKRCDRCKAEETERVERGRYRREMEYAWRRIFPIVNFALRPMWEAPGITSVPLTLGSDGQPCIVDDVLHHWQFRQQAYRDKRDRSVGRIVVGRRLDQEEWTPLDVFLPAFVELGQVL